MIEVLETRRIAQLECRQGALRSFIAALPTRPLTDVSALKRWMNAHEH
jgi:hypothetical protein